MLRFLYTVLFLWFVLPPLSGYCSHLPLKAGAAKIKITPMIPIPLSGFYVRQGIFKGVHDDLYARAVSFESEGKEALIISVDTCILSDTFWDDLTARISKKYPIARDHIFLCASHTHGGPALYEPPEKKDLDTSWLEKNPYLEKQKAYTEEIKEKMVQVVGDARKKLEPARIGYGSGSAAIGVNRRARTVKGDIWLGVNPEGPVDRELRVVRIDSVNGKTLALMFNIGCHGTSMISESITGDWCGLTEQFVEKVWGNEVVACFLPGAGGDVNPIYEEKTVFDARTGGADVLAAIAGEETIRVAKGITCKTEGPLEASQRVVTLPGKKYLGLLGFDPKYDELAKDTSPVPPSTLKMSALHVGNIVFAASSGEIFSEIGMELKKKSPYSQMLFMGLTNGYSGYVLTDKELGRGYEYNATVIKSGGQAAVVNTLLDMMGEW
ncbi:MAG: neutral/alkaline non-lysosomal ceramidase N-terminal domain-containing protein [Candidatus Latescibacter sp.]|nr:neutral/alkaline non-lysosomal ceramidase N-terminal domain-containing protein [Candidatus Latescibacter sp.]